MANLWELSVAQRKAQLNRMDATAIKAILPGVVEEGKRRQCYDASKFTRIRDILPATTLEVFPMLAINKPSWVQEIKDELEKLLQAIEEKRNVANSPAQQSRGARPATAPQQSRRAQPTAVQQAQPVPATQQSRREEPTPVLQQPSPVAQPVPAAQQSRVSESMTDAEENISENDTILTTPSSSGQVQHGNAPVSVRTYSTPKEELFGSIREANKDRVKQILSSNPELLQEKDNVGYTPLQWAVLIAAHKSYGRSGESEVVTTILDVAADSTALLQTKDQCGRTPLHIAVDHKNSFLIKEILNKVRTAEGIWAILQEKNAIGATPLYAAVERYVRNQNLGALGVIEALCAQARRVIDLLETVISEGEPGEKTVQQYLNEKKIEQVRRRDYLSNYRSTPDEKDETDARLARIEEVTRELTKRAPATQPSQAYASPTGGVDSSLSQGGRGSN